MSILIARILLLVTFLYAPFALAATPSPSATSAASAPTAGYCYYPGSNPSTAQNDRPCDPDAETSMCCPTGWTCMSNKICQVTDGTLAQAPVGKIRRATCTDPSWNESVCGNFCLNLPSYELEGDLVPCGDNVFVCSAYAEDKSANCAAKQKVFTLPIGTAQTIIALPTGVTSTSLVPVSTAAGSTLITSTIPSSSATASPKQDNNDESHTKRNIAIGASIGGFFGLAAAAALMYCCCFHRRRDSLSRASTPDSFTKLEAPGTNAPLSAIPAVQDPRPPPQPKPSSPPAGDGGPRYDLYDDGETEIATDGAAVPTSITRRPEHLEAADRDLAGVTGHAYVNDSADTAQPRDVRPGFDASESYISTYDGSRADLLSEGDRPAAGRVSPLHGGK